MAHDTAAIFVDGACPGNGTPSARASWGISVQIHGTEVHARAGPLSPAEAHTNNRAELHAVLHGLVALTEHRAAMLAAGARSVAIYSDSRNAVETALNWGPNSWEPAGWTRPSGPIVNLDLVKRVVDGVRRAQADAALPLRLEHVKGHDSSGSWKARGNSRADALAVAAVAAVAAVGTAAPKKRALETAMAAAPSVSRVGGAAPPSPTLRPAEPRASPASPGTREPLRRVIAALEAGLREAKRIEADVTASAWDVERALRELRDAAAAATVRSSASTSAGSKRVRAETDGV